MEKKALMSIHNSDIAPAPKRFFGFARWIINERVKYMNGIYANMNLMINHSWVNKNPLSCLGEQYIALLSS